MAEPPSSPRELRFTRAHQANVMLGIGMVFLLAAAGLLALHFQRVDHPPAWGWSLIPLPLAALFLWLAWHLARTPFLVLSRVGLEIYPFIRPAENMQLVLWQQITAASVSPDRLVLELTLSGENAARIFVTLKPLPPATRPLLAKAIDGVIASISKSQGDDGS